MDFKPDLDEKYSTFFYYFKRKMYGNQNYNRYKDEKYEINIFTKMFYNYKYFYLCGTHCKQIIFTKLKESVIKMSLNIS